MATQPVNDKTKRNANLRVAAACVVFFTSMIGAAYAAVPLYKLFCQVTGFGGTPKIAAAAPEQILAHNVKVRFDGNVNGGLPIKFGPVTREVEVKLGETRQVSFAATNISSRDVKAIATFNVTPETAGAYFNKLQCFCFNETILKAGETLDMPVLFFVDPSILDDPEASKITTITLSYTFFPVLDEAKKDAQQAEMQLKQTDDRS
ncbi:MAG: cytochrome c oxidase assembly protein [Notoacmeibacter sp.]